MEDRKDFLYVVLRVHRLRRADRSSSFFIDFSTFVEYNNSTNVEAICEGRRREL
jgi:hypothetical protein